MRKFFLCIALLLVTVKGFSQFTLDPNSADQYLKQKAEQAEARRVQDSIRLEQLEEQKMMAADIRYQLKWGNMFTYRQTVGFIENGYNLSYYGYFITKEVWTYPINIRLSGSRGYNSINMRQGFTDWSQNLSYWGLSGFRKIKNDFYLSLGGHIPLGWERYREENDNPADKRRFHLLAGLNAEERVMYMSPNRVGLVLSCGFYQRVMNSKLYTLDAGFSLEVGIKF